MPGELEFIPCMFPPALPIGNALALWAEPFIPPIPAIPLFPDEAAAEGVGGEEREETEVEADGEENLRIDKTSNCSSSLLLSRLFSSFCCKLPSINHWV
ncbi:hypothetical protein SDC9_125743 [bioreactor metagenome]|uniref:Uncharacterized protein n=1 Tax=bioreactor metagenome TaxID=1076179 RepID=A0A645CPS0_9ZZZZ